MLLQFRFIVDGAWKWADDQPVMRDEEGNYINLLEVHEFVPENLESLSGFEPPPSPPSRCFVLLIMPCISHQPKVCGSSVLQAGHISSQLICSYFPRQQPSCSMSAFTHRMDIFIRTPVVLGGCKL